MRTTYLAAFAVLSAFIAGLAVAQPSTEKISTQPAPAAGEVSDSIMIPKTVSNGLVFTGNLSYNRSGSSVTLSADGIYNNSSTRTTGTLRMELWATTSPTTRAGAISGYRLAVGPTLSPLPPQTHYSNVVQTTTFLEPPAGTYYITMALGEYDPSSCSGDDSYCDQDSLLFSNLQTFGNAPPPPAPPPRLGTTTNSLGSRGTVTTTAPMYGGFELAARSTVYVLVRGNSLGTLGVTQGYLDAPRVRLFNAAGQDLVTQGGMAGFNDCVASNTTTDLPIVNYYAQVRGAPVNARDSCYATTLNAGAYTFNVVPSTPATSAGATSIPSFGEVLFEVTFVQ